MKKKKIDIHLLKLLFDRSKNGVYIKEPVGDLRKNSKIKFKLMTKCTEKYQDSPFYRGCVLWAKLSADLQKCIKTQRFRSEIKI